jgi:hypothetical protein
MNRSKRKKYANYLLILAATLLTFAAAYLIILLIDIPHFYLHEGGHMAYGFFDNKLHGRSSEFSITSWKEYPLFSFIKVPQQTTMLEGKPSLNYALGGIFAVILVSLLISFGLCKYTKRNIFLAFPPLFVYYEVVGNFICGTDNPHSVPYALCGYISSWWVYPYFLVFLFLVAHLLYPSIYKRVHKLVFTTKHS